MRLPLTALLLLAGTSALPRGSSSQSNANVLIVYFNDPADVAKTVAAAVASGAERAGATVRSTQVSEANYKRDVLWADAIVVGSGVYNGNAHPDVLAFINTFDFMDDLSNKVGASFATGAAAVGGLQPVLEQINRGLGIFRLIISGGSSWKNSEGTGVTAQTSTLSSEDSALASGEGERVARLAATLKAAQSGGGGSNSTVDAPPGWGDTWAATVSANLTQVGYDAGLVIVNFTAQCSDPSKQQMQTVYGDFYTVLTRCDLGTEFTIAPASRGGGYTSRKIGRDVDARICAACGCPFCVRDTNGTFTHGESSGSKTVWQTKQQKTVQGLETTVWSGRAESATTSGKSFDLETSIAYAADMKTPLFVNVSHPLWVQTAASIVGFTNDIDTAHFSIPESCFKAT